MGRFRVEELRYREYGPVELDIGPGECVAVTGPSGSGKTLLLRALADLDPHEGSVALGDVSQSATDAPTWRRLVGMLPSESTWWHDTVRPHFPADGAYELLRYFGFDQDVMDWEIAQLSSGERQRLGLVRLLLNRPRALLLDEPTASLDPENVEAAERVIADHAREFDAPVVWVSHDSAQAERVADRRYRLRDGNLEQEG